MHPLAHFSDAIPLLTIAIQSPDAKEDLQAVNATENAISAMTKICKHLDTSVPLESILPMWLSWLPVVEDKEEAPHVYNYLCDLIERYTHTHTHTHTYTCSPYICVPFYVVCIFQSC